MKQLITPNPLVPAQKGMCLKYATDAYYLPWKAGYPSASVARQKAVYMHRDNKFPNNPVLVWFTLNNNPDGHVAIRMADGTVWSDSSASPPYRVHHASIGAMQKYYSTVSIMTYWGWSEDLCGVRVVKPNPVQAIISKVVPKPKPKLAIALGNCNVRASATTASVITSTLKKGQTFYYDKIVKGQNVNGNNKWYHSTLGHFVWSGNVKG